MADHRKPELVLTIRRDDGPTVALALFPADEFPGGEDAHGRYRVRVGRAWWRPGGQKYAFLTPAEALAIALDTPDIERGERPDLPLHTYVRVPSPGLAGAAFCTRTWTRSAPFQGPDGRWRVLCALIDEPVLVETIARVEVRRDRSHAHKG